MYAQEESLEGRIDRQAISRYPSRVMGILLSTQHGQHPATTELRNSFPCPCRPVAASSSVRHTAPSCHDSCFCSITANHRQNFPNLKIPPLERTESLLSQETNAQMQGIAQHLEWGILMSRILMWMYHFSSGNFGLGSLNVLGFYVSRLENKLDGNFYNAGQVEIMVSCWTLTIYILYPE